MSAASPLLPPCLEGLRVVEISAFVAAPLGGMTLAQMGADVIRIDPLQGGLDYRRWPVTADNESLFWRGLNKGKRSVAIDTSTAEGRELCQRIIAAPGPDAGFFVTNLPARGWMSYDALRAARPDLVQLTLQGDRHGGSAVDYTVNPRVGLPYLTGAGSADEVVNHVLPAWDLVAGHLLAIGLLGAERQRTRTGRGQEVRLALEDVALAMISHLGFVAEAQLGAPRQRHGNELFGAFGRDFVCADGVRIMLVALTLKQWRALCEAMQLGSAMSELGRGLGLDLDREGDRFQAREAIAEWVADWVGRRSFAQASQALQQHGVCWSRYQSLQQLVASDPECSPANPLFSSIDQSGIGRTLAAGLPLNFGAGPRLEARLAPALGQHTEAVALEVAGLSSAEFGRLVDRGIVRQAKA
ncbi:CoA transferase [Roseateles violae]|uniref:CoA transferase n=1 Tax=Roseateles violae TaxID=3058042 RepID=A0ABT8DTT1_9BURK|nr:CoA transferase [Pelomonas sp. PFR6]MDN3921486.1 CoA transferase [Pelomonas sp. PFR6]